MNLLVTGANGFIASHFIRRCSREAGIHVRGCVRSNERQVPDFVEKHVLGDLSSSTDWRKALSGIDCVIHLAAKVHDFAHLKTDPSGDYRQVNVDATLSLAQAAIKAGVRRFIYLSSIGVNGENNDKPFLESDIPAPKNPYAISKLDAETGLRELVKNTQLELVIIRPPLVYGSEAPGNFNTLTKFLGRGVPLPLKSIVNRRSFIGIENLVDFLIISIKHPDASNEIFLISDGEDVSTTVFVERISEAMGVAPRLFYIPRMVLTAGAVLLGRRHIANSLFESLQLDISKARRVLGWVPPVTMKSGLQGAVGDHSA